MRILAIADEPSPRLWGERVRQELEGIDLILSAGDLPARYLSYLTCFTSAPIVYVRGNHDDIYEENPPEGCICAEDTVVEVNGVRILGLGGSMRYRRDGSNMYSEQEMSARIRKLRFRLRMTGGFD
ncbi:MAG: metallophosphoesterase, partial [Clostridium sp.]|nr:metallophosphoesterase [Clostridium sp.]